MLLLLLVLLPIANINCLDCYQCQNVLNLSDCHTVVVCPSDTLCSIEVASVGGSNLYNLTCKPKMACPNTNSSSPASFVGRRSTTDCSECCSKDACNKHLCSGWTQAASSQCSDDPAMDCAHISTYYDICADVQHSKTVCRKFCNLCSLVDGVWTTWSNWTRCDVTCENGTITRTRSCSNPAPANGGLDCVGVSSETNTCQRAACPVAGGWSSWSLWTNCSVGCGVGLQKRHRTCTNPIPDRYGDHCFGDGVDVNICISHTCNGTSNWSSWEPWSTCSVSCGYGQQQRKRTCAQTHPQDFMDHCIGTDMDVQICNLRHCHNHQVAFAVTGPNGTLVGGSPIFRTVKLNVGNSYNQTTGKFTCPIAGVYYFSLTLFTTSGTRYNVYCFIRKNSSDMVYAYSANGDYDSASSSVFLQLAAGDIVDLACYGWQYIYTSYYYTSFTGSLIRED